MILNLNVSRDPSTIRKQRKVANLVTSQRFINLIAQKVERELRESNEGPYVYTHDQDKAIMAQSQPSKVAAKGLRRSIFSDNRR
ncbi:MAG: hypothetical protein J1F35_03045 [Erysipelotrichales bacterium]|nr:hypothetical protein [Erysipelotrichales bacterium]